MTSIAGGVGPANSFLTVNGNANLEPKNLSKQPLIKMTATHTKGKGIYIDNELMK